MVTIAFIISGLDDLFYDVYYWFTTAYAKIIGRKHLVVNDKLVDEIRTLPEKRVAMMIPCWKEEKVIEQMIRYNLSRINYANFDVFIGCYPNDLEFMQIIKRLQKEFTNLHLTHNNKSGPTTKGDNLNSILKHVYEYEKEHNIKYDFFVMNDAEDVIHPYALKLFNTMMGEYDMLQIPVLPLRTKPWYNFNYWSYCDEFAENHNKDMVVRNRIHGLVPSAGTGTALSRKCVMSFSKNGTVGLFDKDMFTEDYDLAYRVLNKGLKQAFIKEYIPVWDEKEQEEREELIAIREYFPDKYNAAVTQKSRWVYGIVFQEWDKHHWEGDYKTKFNLIHDRKALFSHFAVFLGYLVFLYFFISYFFPEVGLVNFIEKHSSLWYMLIITFIIMVNRLLERVIAVTTHYGLLQGILSIPRIIWSNVINVHATIKSFKIYTRHLRHEGITWNKTEHEFPTFKK